MRQFQQKRLNSQEWLYLERDYSTHEKNILSMLSNGYYNENVKHFNYNFISSIVKLTSSQADFYIYDVCFKKMVQSFQRRYATIFEKLENFQTDNIKLKALKKADKIRIDNTLQSESTLVESTIEYQMMMVIKKLLKEWNSDKKYHYYMYSLACIHKQNKNHFNSFVYKFIGIFSRYYHDQYSEYVCKMILKNSSRIIENNSLMNYVPVTLYSHQKSVFNVFRDNKDVPKLVYYTAPTSSGKTLTPIGIINEYRIIFLCASKHIGLQLAKNMIMKGKKVAFAFGCNGSEDIRLHYNAVNTYITTKHYHKILKKVDNSDGIKVEIMISDIQSYEYAMLYMCAFNKPENIVLFWDEPTIILDQVSSPFHENISNIWKKNKIPNIVLSSATLPGRKYIPNIEKSFMEKFGDLSIVVEVTSNDNISNIKLFDPNGKCIMPHTFFMDNRDLNEYLSKYDEKYDRLFSTEECSSFILYFIKNMKKSLIDYFPDIDSINTKNIKRIYFNILSTISPDYWKIIVESYKIKHDRIHNIGPELTSRHAKSIVNGPCLFITENPQIIVKYLNKISKIDKSILNIIQQNIEFNHGLKSKIDQIEREISFELESKNVNDDESTKHNDSSSSKLSQSIEKKQSMVEQLQKKFKTISLPFSCIPNTLDHYDRFRSDGEDGYHESDVFTSSLDNETIEKIMKLDISIEYKILCLQGIGIINREYNNEDYSIYENIIKELMDDKRLFVAIVNSDYIYGVNYQFSHCYLAKDIEDISHEKIIQSIGRVGRKEKNKFFHSDSDRMITLKSYSQYHHMNVLKV